MNITQIFDLQSIDLLAVGITSLAIGMLGVIVFFNNRRDVSARTFFFFSIITIGYGVFNYTSYQLSSPNLILWFLRLTIFFAVWHAFSFFQLAYVLPKDTKVFPKWYKFALVPLVTFTALLTLTPLIFSGIEQVAANGVSNPEEGPLIPLFGGVVTGLVAGGLFFIFKKTIKAVGLEKKQFKIILLGTVITFSSLIFFNFILPVIFNNLRFIPLAPIFILPFVVLTTYSIARHRLFNIRVIATEFFAVFIGLVFLINTLLSNSIQELIFNFFLLLISSLFAILLVRGTLREIRELERLSKAKSDFVAIVSHQLRTPLTAIKGFVSMIKEGSGTEESRRDWLDKTYATNERMIRLVDDILNISRIERGKLQYTFKDTDIVNLIEGVISETRMQADGKGLILKWEKPTADVPLIRADEGKLRQVILNLVDNAIHYTDKGHINVRLTYLPDLRRVKITVQDTGIGMSKEDLTNLFEQFSRGRGGQKTNVGGLGLGLYVAQSIAKAHNGKIWAESDGLHKGSRFYVELPVQ